MPARLSVYFDGLCPLCSREIAHYRKRVTPEAVEFVDIAAPGFDPVALGFDRVRVHRHLHARFDGTALRRGRCLSRTVGTRPRLPLAPQP